MRLPYTLVVTLLAHSAFGWTPAKRTYDTHDYYVVEHDANSGASLVDVAHALGVEVVDQAGELQNHWVVRIPKASILPRGENTDPVLRNFEDLRERAASHLSSRSEDALHARSIVSSVPYLSERQELRQRAKRAPPPIRPPVAAPSVYDITQKFGIADPLFPKQWHIVNEEYPQHMMNVTPLWDLGFTGHGVISSVIDDGLDYTSEDLVANFDADNSYDFNDHQALPTPKKANDHHGTRCAGQIAAGKNNVCGVGIAYDSKVAGVRILSKPISDVDEAVALNYGFQNVSVYSCSWGPPDNGKAMGAPSYLIKKSVLNGINNGRGGKGSIFVFASGNGAGHGDQCNFDGYTNSIYSVTVSAVDYKGKHPWYSEACAANMITAYSSGSGRHIVTTDKGKNQCATSHGGTSAAAPNAAAVFVLAIQARPDLTWRDIQYLSIKTAKMINPDDPDWERTATGRSYSYKYGFGVLDGYEFVMAAQNWTLVKPQAWFFTDAVQLEGGTMNEAKNFTGGQPIGPGGVTSQISVTEKMMTDNNFETLEHVNIQVWIDHTRRGDVEVEVVSPNGIKSILGGRRAGDDAKTGYPGWVFMTIKHWGENPVGNWTIKVSDLNHANETGKFLGWRIKFWGTTVDASKAKKYELPLVDDVLPPTSDPSRPIIITSTATTEHSKPTVNSPTESSSSGFDNIEGWINDMSNIVSAHRPYFGIIGFVVILGVFSSICFWRRRAAHLRSHYNSVSTREDVEMDEADRIGPVSAGRHPQDRISQGLGFHSSFLDDDDASTAGLGPTPKYRDEPAEVVPPIAAGIGRVSEQKPGGDEHRSDTS